MNNIQKINDRPKKKYRSRISNASNVSTNYSFGFSMQTHERRRDLTALRILSTATNSSSSRFISRWFIAFRQRLPALGTPADPQLRDKRKYQHRVETFLPKLEDIFDHMDDPKQKDIKDWVPYWSPNLGNANGLIELSWADLLYRRILVLGELHVPRSYGFVRHHWTRSNTDDLEKDEEVTKFRWITGKKKD